MARENSFDLKVDRSLIDPQFESYKLSLDPLPSYKFELQCGVDRVSLSDTQISYQHVKAFSAQNHLCNDPFNTSLIFYIDQSWNVICFNTDSTGKSNPGQIVFTIPGASDDIQTANRHNITLTFSSSSLAILGTGTGRLFILDTGQRTSTNSTWEVQLECSPLPDARPFVIRDAVLREDDEKQCLECLVLRVEEVEKTVPIQEQNDEEQVKESVSTCETLLDWISFIPGSGVRWIQHRVRRLRSTRCPDYVQFDQNAAGVFVCCDHAVKFIYDSVSPVIVHDEEPQTVSVPVYTWTQTNDDITMTIPVPPGSNKDGIQFNVTPSSLAIHVQGESELEVDGELENSVIADECTWTLLDQCLTIHLSKANPSSILWTKLIKGDNRGELVLDEEQLSAVHEQMSHLTSDKMNPDPSSGHPPAFNTQQLEECDVGQDDNAMFMYVDGETHQVTHQASLMGHQWLFTTPACLGTKRLSAVCLRHDVDGIIWQPQNKVVLGSSPWEHIATFNALGYVQASKQQRVFTSCSPDFSYAVIADSVRHLYVYHQPEPITSPIRNRKTGRQVKAVAKQQVITVDSVDDIIGLVVGSHKVCVLTTRSFHVVTIKMT